jgi:hypothetical protein
MKGKFQNVQQLAIYITEKEATDKPLDEINISQANSIAKEVIKRVGAIGGQDTVRTLNKQIMHGKYEIGKASLSPEQMDRVCLIIEELFSWEFKLFFPWSKARKNTRNLKRVCKQYGYLDKN